MADEERESAADPIEPTPHTASELNNVLQIISGTTELMENIWGDRDASGKYFAMLRAGIERAEEIAGQLVRQAGGTNQKILLHPDLAAWAQPRIAARPTPPKKRILIVDDEEMTLSLMKTILEDAGFHVVTGRSGFECLDFLASRQSAFDLILLDLNMPIMDGEETFGRIRASCPDLPVVLYTGFIDQPRLDRMLAGGLTGLVRKPQTGADLVASVRSILQNSRRFPNER